MLEIYVSGPDRATAREELVADWSKADMDKLQESLATINWVEAGDGLRAVEEWDLRKEILEEEVKKCRTANILHLANILQLILLPNNLHTCILENLHTWS